MAITSVSLYMRKPRKLQKFKQEHDWKQPRHGVRIPLGEFCEIEGFLIWLVCTAAFKAALCFLTKRRKSALAVHIS